LVRIHMYRNGGGADPFVRERESLSNTMSLGQAYLRTIWHLDAHSRFATVDTSRSLRRHACTRPQTAKVAGLLCSFPGGAAGSPSNTMSLGLHRTKSGPKIGGSPPVFGGGELGPRLPQCGRPGPRSTSMSSAILIHPAVWAQ